MAFQLACHWTHRQILTAYLNSIYFGNGALGIEAAARVYFGWAHGYDAANPADGGKDACGDADPGHPSPPRVRKRAYGARGRTAAAGMVANPSAFNPAGTESENNRRPCKRHDLVLYDMY